MILEQSSRIMRKNGPSVLCMGYCDAEAALREGYFGPVEGLLYHISCLAW